MIDAQNIEELFIEENLMFLLTLKIDQIWIKGPHIKEKKIEGVEREGTKKLRLFWYNLNISSFLAPQENCVIIITVEKN